MRLAPNTCRGSGRGKSQGKGSGPPYSYGILWWTDSPSPVRLMQATPQFRRHHSGSLSLGDGGHAWGGWEEMMVERVFAVSCWQGSQGFNAQLLLLLEKGFSPKTDETLSITRVEPWDPFSPALGGGVVYLSGPPSHCLCQGLEPLCWAGTSCFPLSC